MSELDACDTGENDMEEKEENEDTLGGGVPTLCAKTGPAKEGSGENDRNPIGNPMQPCIEDPMVVSLGGGASSISSRPSTAIPTTTPLNTVVPLPLPLPPSPVIPAATTPILIPLLLVLLLL